MHLFGITLIKVFYAAQIFFNFFRFLDLAEGRTKQERIKNAINDLREFFIHVANAVSK